jgi:cytochrome b561
VIAEAAIGHEIVAFDRKSGRSRHSSGPAMKVFPPPRVVAVYNPALRAVHWLMAILIFAALALGVWAIQLPRSDFRSEVLFVHKSLGVTVFALVILRIVVRLIVGAPAYARPLGRLVHAAASSGHLALYALMIAMPVTGYAKSATGGNSVSFFGLFAVPSILLKDKALAEAAGQAHYVFAWLLGATLVLHLAAVIWHARIKRDEVLTRMWPRFRPAPVPR